MLQGVLLLVVGISDGEEEGAAQEEEKEKKEEEGQSHGFLVAVFAVQCSAVQRRPLLQDRGTYRDRELQYSTTINRTDQLITRDVLRNVGYLLLN